MNSHLLGKLYNIKKSINALIPEVDTVSFGTKPNEYIFTIPVNKNKFDSYQILFTNGKMTIMSSSLDDKEIVNYIQSLLDNYKEPVGNIYNPNYCKKRTLEIEIARKEEAERLRSLPRIPELQKLSTYQLLSLMRHLTCSCYQESHNYTEEEYRAELAHRPHIYTKKDGKIRRRLLAQGKIQNNG